MGSVAYLESGRTSSKNYWRAYKPRSDKRRPAEKRRERWTCIDDRHAIFPKGLPQYEDDDPYLQVQGITISIATARAVITETRIKNGFVGLDCPVTVPAGISTTVLKQAKNQLPPPEAVV